MKYLILSDSHGNIKNLEFAIKNSHYDKVLFLGDGLKDLKYFKDIQIEAVKGNCDYFIDHEEVKVLADGKHKIFLTHGHRYGVKYTLDDLVRKAKEINADIVCFGHTHKFTEIEKDGILLVNPGSIGSGKPCSFAIMTINDENINITQIPLSDF